MPKKIISKEKVLQVYPDARIKSHTQNTVYWVVAANLTFNKTLSEPQAWYSAWKSINAEQKRLNGKENKAHITLRIKPSAIKAITDKYGSVQKWVDDMTQDFLTK
jgi:putative alpha-1,2-mannosidase